MKAEHPFVLEFSRFGRADIALVGGKNASLGEMIAHLTQAGIRVPGGFATTAAAYWAFIGHNHLKKPIGEALAGLDAGHNNLADIGHGIRTLILNADMPPRLIDEIKTAYAALSQDKVAVRSSATAEDLPEASFAGQLESFLNVQGIDALLGAIRRCFASLYTDRAIIYRENHGFSQLDVALSVGVQSMVRSDLGGSGVMFTIDTDTGFPRIVLINAAFGLGESVVQGLVDPDEYMAFKPFLTSLALRPIVEKRLGGKRLKMVFASNGGSKLVEADESECKKYVLSDDEILELARWAVTIEEHYGQAMDIEWAKDGETDELFIVQARPETVQSQRGAALLKTYELKEKAKPLLSGLSIGSAIATGRVCRLSSASDIANFRDNGVLVTATTDPDWVPIMKRAAAIVTDHGGRTSHAAIVSRELGLTAVVGTGNATDLLQDGQEITVSCAEGEEGHIYAGALTFEARELDIAHIPETRTKIMINMANPAAAFRWWRLPTDGVGLARIEFIIANIIKVHPMALLHFDRVENEQEREAISRLTTGFSSMPAYFVDHLTRGMARIAAAHHPNPVIIRMSDFKTNEYAALLGGAAFEPQEENPMIGWRGASRYYSDGYREGFALECQAIKRAREDMGFWNIVVMIPFCRTLDEADHVLLEMAKNGLERGKNGLFVYVMCEIPANVILAGEFARRFDGFSIGSNDLTQLTLGVDRDSDMLSHLFDERNPAVTASIASLLQKTQKTRTKTGLCGQAPSDHPEFARFLVENKIDSISVSPDSFLSVKKIVATAER